MKIVPDRVPSEVDSRLGEPRAESEQPVDEVFRYLQGRSSVPFPSAPAGNRRKGVDYFAGLPGLAGLVLLGAVVLALVIMQPAAYSSWLPLVYSLCWISYLLARKLS